jgi:hypothetical protein
VEILPFTIPSYANAAVQIAKYSIHPQNSNPPPVIPKSIKIKF